MAERCNKAGWVEVICGCMFSGKSEELIRRVKRAQIAKQRVRVFQQSLDARYGEKCIAAHSGLNLDAITVHSAADILQAVDPETQLVAVDEAQFFDEALIDVCQALADRGMRVIVAGLDMDFRGEPFGCVPSLLARAEKVDKLQAICVVCGESATRTQRLIDGRLAFYDDPIIMVGASEVYEARCRFCHDVPGKDGV